MESATVCLLPVRPLMLFLPGPRIGGHFPLSFLASLVQFFLEREDFEVLLDAFPHGLRFFDQACFLRISRVRLERSPCTTSVLSLDLAVSIPATHLPSLELLFLAPVQTVRPRRPPVLPLLRPPLGFEVRLFLFVQQIVACTSLRCFCQVFAMATCF